MWFKTKKSLALTVGLVIAIVAATIGVASATASSATTIYACINKVDGTIRIVSNCSQCKKNESPLSWNQVGAAGVGIASVVDNGDGTFTLNLTDGSSFTTSNLTGPQGLQGEQGPKGDTGAPGVGLNLSHQTVIGPGYLTTAGIWSDLPDSYGPEVTANIGSSGSALVTLTAEIIVYGDSAGFMSFLVTGASDLEPAELRGLSLVNYTHGFIGRMRTSGSVVVTGLNLGSNVFTTKYYSAGGTCLFQYRTIIVQPLP